MSTLTSEQKYELLRQICVDYGLYNYINEDRACWPYETHEVGADLTILERLVSNKEWTSFIWEVANERIKYRLGIK